MRNFKIINLPVAGGKTTELIKQAAKDGGYIVCINHEEIKRIQMMAKEMGLNISMPITYDNFINYKGWPNFMPVYIDNADDFLDYIAAGVGLSLRTVTMTVRKEELK